jgi:aminopeptidase YwaD
MRCPLALPYDSPVMRRLLLTATAVTLGLAAPVGAQRFPDDARLQEAYVAWDRGDYPDAIQAYLAVLSAPDGVRHVEEIARLTGELYVVDEVTPRGLVTLRLGPSGRFVSFRFLEEGRVLTRVADLSAGGRAVATIDAATTTLMAGAVAYVPTGTAEVRLRTLPDGPERTLDLQDWQPAAQAGSPEGLLVASPEGDALFILAGRVPGAAASDVLRYREGALTVLPTGDGLKSNLQVAAGGRFVIYSVLPDAAPGGGGRGAGVGGGAVAEPVVLDLSTGQPRHFPGRTQPAVSRDGSTLALVGRDGAAFQIEVVKLTSSPSTTPTVVVRSTMPIQSPALSPSGATIAYQGRPLHDWEIYAAPAVENAGITQLTMEIQHDISPTFVDERTVLALKGEARHRRSHLYDIETRAETKLFHNNTVRTIAPEYEWRVSNDGTKVVIIADRDGDTISRDRGVYVVHLDRTISLEVLRRRLEGNLAAERDLRARGEQTFAPIRDAVGLIAARVEPERIYQYARTLYAMGSKHITQPGNAQAIAYLERTLRAWGYDVELQWFDTPVGAGTVRTANVVARLPGTVNPDLVYAASSHFDSVAQGAGADDNSSGSTALLEVARVLRAHPQPATIELAWFTAEESGLRGSREYVRLAVASGKRIVGALNNDMVGWTRHHRLDNTIRYSNSGIRDIQHAAAIQFSDLITYDSHYYQSTDAAAYYEAYGDIVGGIGSYPILESPHYHQSTDRIENVNMRLVAEVARTTVATLMLLASSPARLTDVEAHPAGAVGTMDVSWNSAPERGVIRYRARWRTGAGETTTREVAARGQARMSLRLDDVAPGSMVEVKAVNDRGLEGWDWARARARAVTRP